MPRTGLIIAVGISYSFLVLFLLNTMYNGYSVDILHHPRKIQQIYDKKRRHQGQRQKKRKKGKRDKHSDSSDPQKTDFIGNNTNISHSSSKKSGLVMSTLGAVVILAPARYFVSFNVDRLCLLFHMLQNLDKHFISHFPMYNVFILVASDYAQNPDPNGHDGEYTDEDRKKIRSFAPNTKITFIEIPMYSGEALTPKPKVEQILRWSEGLDGGIGGRPLGYRSMCRLFSGRLQNLNFLSKYKFYMRMDDDSVLISQILHDPFLNMEEKGLRYVFHTMVDTMNFGGRVLWNVTKLHLKSDVQRKTMTHFNFAKKGKDGNLHITGNQPYNNFHISDIALWRSEKFHKFYLDMQEANGFYKFRFGDANVHAMIIGLFLKISEVKRISIPYKHNTNEMPGYPPKSWGCPYKKKHKVAPNWSE